VAGIAESQDASWIFKAQGGSHDLKIMSPFGVYLDSQPHLRVPDEACLEPANDLRGRRGQNWRS